MSVVAPEQQQPAAPPQLTAVPAPVPPPLPVVRPRITANRKLLVRRFPSLSFTIWTGGLPYWEVLLFTDRSLIDPRNASRRTPSNFYSSRQDGGLRLGQDGDVFLVPSAVLRSFAASVPAPTAIYYTVAAYATADGASPVLPEPPEVLALDAPFVAVSSDFTPDTVSQVLGVHATRLQVVAQALAEPATTVVVEPAPQAAAPTPAIAVAPTAPAAPPEIDPVEDAAAGEDGYAYYAAHPEELLQGTENGQPLVAAAPTPPPAPVADDGYDDGYGAFDGSWDTHEASWGEQSSPFQVAAEPRPLIDEDEDARYAELDGVSRHFGYRGLEDEVVDDAASSDVAPAPVAVAPAVQTPPLSLTIDQKRAIIEKVAGAESGRDRYGAINADGEYRGRFGPDHPAYHHHHIGLSYGIIQFTQESGNLGRLLTMMRDRNLSAFAQNFGDAADELIRVTTSAGPPSSESEDGRSSRTQPVAGADLWEEPWLSRFREAGNVVEFQAAQNELAATAFLDPILRFAGDLGLDTDRALAMAYDRAVQMGVNGARHWIIAAVGPISTPALRQQALAAVGFGDLASFQQAAGLDADNLWGPVTHAALVAACRQLGTASPIQLPALDQMLDAMVRRAETDQAFWARRVKRLRTDSGFTDQPYAR
jgi:hypothetical protein